jgi:hypothetical protein
MNQTITCPDCQREIHLEEALAKRVEGTLKAEFSARTQELEKREEALRDAQKKQEVLLAQRLAEKEIQFKRELLDKLRTEQNGQKEALEQELSEKSNRINELLRNEADLRRQQRELEEAKASVELEIEKRISQEKAALETKAREKAQTEAQLALTEKEILIQQLRDRVADMTRKMEQGSMQLQGEAQEVALEQLLRESHPGDSFDEIKKGELGADLAQVVRNPFGRDCGVILYESKRTKTFNEEWIAKLKHDMQLRKADIGVLVTQALPKGVTQFELRESNIYICTFGEVKALSYCLRATLVKVDEVRVVQANQGDKSRMLYDYLMGAEFRNQLQLIHSTFQKMHSSLAKEKQSVIRRLKQREKEIDQVLVSFSEVVGSLNGIAGHTVAEFEDFELVEEEPTLIE